MPERSLVDTERREIDCVMRDGVRLRTILLIPQGDGPWPGLLTRHPYDVRGDETDGLVDVSRLVAAGYLVALQDVRGRYASEGIFDPSAREAEDGADAAAWLAALPECTGDVGMFGASYASETQISALLGGAASVRSIVPAVTPVSSGLDGFRFRGGVPEIGSMLAWSHFAIAPNVIDRISDPVEQAAERARWAETDRAIASGEAFRAGALDAGQRGESTVEWMRDRLREQLDSASHSVGKIGARIDAVAAAPALIIGGWFDVFLGSTLELYRRLREHAGSTGTPEPRLLVGPWSHGNLTGRFGDVDFGAGASAADLDGCGDLTELHLRWFDATLRGARDTYPFGPVRIFLTGANRWSDLDEFPPREAGVVDFYFGEDGALLREPGSDGGCRFPVDPEDPVPTRGGATLLFPPYDAGPAEQGELEERPDVVSWRSARLDSDLAAIGPVRAVVHLESTGTDADLVVRLCDEGPDGRTRVVADGVRRASTRALDVGTSRGERLPMTPSQPVELAVDLWSVAHVFRAGHRVRVDLAASSSPRWAVNTGRFEPAAASTEPVPTEHTVSFGVRHPSRLVLTVMPDASRAADLPGSPTPRTDRR